MSSIPRREALAASAMFIGTWRSWAIANSRIRTAIIGVGGRGRDHIGLALRQEDVQIASLCDPDETRMAQGASIIEKQTGRRPKLEPDLRRILEDRDIDTVIIASPNRWHALTGIWACQAGKHAIVEKPVCHVLAEGRLLVQAARTHSRIVQGGTQMRSSPVAQRAVELLQGGVIGRVHMARCIHYQIRDSLGFKAPSPPPANLHWDLWLGPAPQQPYHANLVHYNWHWFWEFGNGELGNNGVHKIDIARWALNKGLPVKVFSSGGRFGYEDQGETPNTQVASFEYDDGTQIVCEIRGRFTNPENGFREGITFYGSKGYMTLGAWDPQPGYRIFMNGNKEPEPDRGNSQASRADADLAHSRRFFASVREGKPERLAAEIEQTYLSTSICLLGNISYRLGRSLRFDPHREQFVGDSEANQMLKDFYRAPYLLPEQG